MSFKRLTLEKMRRDAGLIPLPEFHNFNGNSIVGDTLDDYIDHRYFSPEALHWLYKWSDAQRGEEKSSPEERECCYRILMALRANKKPSPVAQDRFRKKQLLRYLESLLPEAVQVAATRYGYRFNPDFDFETPPELANRSQLELLYEYAAKKFGAPSKQAVRQYSNRIRRYA